MNKSRIIIPAAALIVGVGIGAASAGAPEAGASTTKEVVPKACLKALDTADLLIGTSQEAMGLVSEHLQSDADIWGGLAEDDYSALLEGPAKMQDFTRKINALTERITNNGYGASADECRGK